MTENDIAALLLQEARRINSPAFIADDPVQFPHRFSEKNDREIAGLLAASLAWGRRPMIIRDVDRLLAMMDNNPYECVMAEAYEEWPDDINIHRTVFGRDVKWLLRGLRHIYRNHPSLDDFCADVRKTSDDLPPWALADAINAACALVNENPTCSRILPAKTATSALKRLNMFLRWMVRSDNIVDLGIWSSISPDELFIPLDVHVGETSRELGLVSRKANDRRTVVELTEKLRQISPQDPILLDFALFGIPLSLRGN